MAEKMNSIEDLMITGMTYTLDFENQVSEQSKVMAEASSNPELKEAFQKSEAKGKEYAQRIQQTFEKMGKPVSTNDNHIAKAMIMEVENMIQHTDAGPIRDAALIVAANQMQHYRVAVYGSLSHYAELVNKSDAAKELDQNLEDSKGGDEKLTKIGEEKVNQQAAHAAA